MKLKTILVLLFCSMFVITSCDDNTESLGIYSQADAVSNSTGVYEIISGSKLMDNVIANSTSCYLGKVVDPECGSEITAEFIAQFATLEDYALPEMELTKRDEEDNIICDSCELRLYFDSYYGDGKTPLKIEVFELASPLDESTTYTTNMDLTQFVKDLDSPIATRVITPIDYTLTSSELNSSTHSNNVRIMLPNALGSRILNEYYQNPSYFSNSFNFTHKILPGFYVRATNESEGTMLKLYVSSLNIYFDYRESATKEDYTSGMSRFSATPEVIQTTHFNNSDLYRLLAEENGTTYLKTPAGIYTELTLPINEVFNSTYEHNGITLSHSTDSISLASITLTKYNSKENSDKFALKTPNDILLIRIDEIENFFKERKVADSRTSYITSFDSNYNTYSFKNIARLITYCNNEKKTGIESMMLQPEYVGKTYQEVSALWENENPNWNKVAIIPVTITKNNNQELVSVNNEMSITSAKLVGGNKKVHMEVTYSRFQ